VVWKNTQMRTVTNLFIVNLSTADLLAHWRHLANTTDRSMRRELCDLSLQSEWRLVDRRPARTLASPGEYDGSIYAAAAMRAVAAVAVATRRRPTCLSCSCACRPPSSATSPRRGSSVGRSASSSTISRSAPPLKKFELFELYYWLECNTKFTKSKMPLIACITTTRILRLMYRVNC